jgi:hypothetical protein
VRFIGLRGQGSHRKDSLRHDFGSVGLVAAVEVQVEPFFFGGLDEVHVGADEVGHDCGVVWGVGFVEKVV